MKNIKVFRTSGFNEFLLTAPFIDYTIENYTKKYLHTSYVDVADCMNSIELYLSTFVTTNWKIRKKITKKPSGVMIVMHSGLMSKRLTKLIKAAREIFPIFVSRDLTSQTYGEIKKWMSDNYVNVENVYGLINRVFVYRYLQSIRASKEMDTDYPIDRKLKSYYRKSPLDFIRDYIMNNRNFPKVI